MAPALFDLRIGLHLHCVVMRLERVDETHANGICYAIATLVTEENGKDKLTLHAVRYYDKYVKMDGRWWIAEREQHFVYSSVPPLV